MVWCPCGDVLYVTHCNCICTTWKNILEGASVWRLGLNIFFICSLFKLVQDDVRIHLDTVRTHAILPRNGGYCSHVVDILLVLLVLLEPRHFKMGGDITLMPYTLCGY